MQKTDPELPYSLKEGFEVSFQEYFSRNKWGSEKEKETKKVCMQ